MFSLPKLSVGRALPSDLVSLRTFSRGTSLKGGSFGLSERWGGADGPTQKGDPFLKGAMCGWQATSVILIRWYLPMFRRGEGHCEPCNNMNMGSLWSLRTMVELMSGRHGTPLVLPWHPSSSKG